jgi:hypothetical protein
MYRKITLIVIAIMFFGVSFSPVDAKEPKIEDYIFIWHAAKVGDVVMDIEKTRKTLQVVLRSPGGALGRVSATPSQAEIIGEVLKKTNEYYDKQSQSQDSKSEDMAPAGDYKIYFTSKRGRDFKVSVRGPKAFGGAALMGQEEAITMSGFLLQAKKFAALVNKKINP